MHLSVLITLPNRVFNELEILADFKVLPDEAADEAR